MQPFDYIQQQLGVSGSSAASDQKPLQSALPPPKANLNGQPSSAAAASATASASASPKSSTAIGFRTFACGHVIPPTSILPLSIAKGPTGVDMDFTFKSRGTTEQVLYLCVCVYVCFCSLWCQHFSFFSGSRHLHI